MRKIYILFFMLTLPILCMAKSDDEVTLTVVGEGKTTDEAVKVALRSAVEQVYGAFVSANTEILNDELVKDEIVSISSGSVSSYKILESIKLPNDNIFVSVTAKISKGKMITYAKSKGATCELAGSNFMANVNLIRSNIENSKKILDNFYRQIQMIKDETNLFDYTLEAYPMVGSVTFTVKANLNQNYENLEKLRKSAINTVTIPKDIRKQMEKMGMNMTERAGIAVYAWDDRIDTSLALGAWEYRQFAIHDNLGNYYFFKNSPQNTTSPGRDYDDNKYYGEVVYEGGNRYRVNKNTDKKYTFTCPVSDEMMSRITGFTIEPMDLATIKKGFMVLGKNASRYFVQYEPNKYEYRSRSGYEYVNVALQGQSKFEEKLINTYFSKSIINRTSAVTWIGCIRGRYIGFINEKLTDSIPYLFTDEETIIQEGKDLLEGDNYHVIDFRKPIPTNPKTKKKEKRCYCKFFIPSDYETTHRAFYIRQIHPEDIVARLLSISELLEYCTCVYIEKSEANEKYYKLIQGIDDIYKLVSLVPAYEFTTVSCNPHNETEFHQKQKKCFYFNVGDKKFLIQPCTIKSN